MAIMNIFKNKKKTKANRVKSAAVKNEFSDEKEKLIVGIGAKKVESHKILKSPQITEKATFLSDSGKYVFKTFSDVNKIEIKKAIEDVYNVKVESVNIINVPRKRKRLGRISGFKTGYKKAIVSLKEGGKIEVLPR